MDSDDDNISFYDSDSDSDNYYNNATDSDTDEDSGGNTSSSRKPYTVLSESDIKNRQLGLISDASAVLSISEVAASRLLYCYKWNVSQLHDEWFADEYKVRSDVGLPVSGVPLLKSGELITCGICFDDLELEEFYPMVCGHLCCRSCWKGYIGTSINDGPGCLMLRCPEPACRVAVCRDVIEELAMEEEREKYERYFMRSYVEESKKIKWCPSAGCENAMEMELGNNVFDVTCVCSGTFCWNCGEDAHRPVDCDTVAKWVLRNSSESENTTWILANSKGCPKCKRPIEKNHGCMHMTCTPPCNFEFCWLCLGDWKEHNQSSGGFYACNKYSAAKAEGVYDEEERIRKMAKNSLNRYVHFYERWVANQKSREKAIQDWKALDTGTLVALRRKTNETEGQLKCIAEAWEQIIECRRVLKWTYAYGYYVLDDNHDKKQFFEYIQGEAEAQLEKLHNHTEKGLADFIQNEEETDFTIFREKLVGLTAVNRSYFTKLVAFFETQKL